MNRFLPMGSRPRMSCTLTFCSMLIFSWLMAPLRAVMFSIPVVPGGSLRSLMRHDLTFDRHISGSFFLRLAMLALTSGLFLAAYSMALRALLHGWHIHRGLAWVAVFVRRCSGRGGPHPNTQLNIAMGMGLPKVACGGCP